MTRFSAILAASLLCSHAVAVQEGVMANPIRKVVTMMQRMAKKIDKEADKEEDLYKKFQCYCKTSIADLEAAIEKASSNPITVDDLNKKKAELKAAKDEVQKLKDDKAADEESLASARSNRNKEHEKYEKEIKEDTETEKAAEGALKALGGKDASFLQEGSISSKSFSPKLIKALERSTKITSFEKDKLTAFLQGGDAADSAGVDDVKVYIKDVEEDAEEEIKEDNKEENTEVEDYNGVKKSKKQEIKMVLDQMEKKMKKVGALEVEIVNMKHDMQDGAAGLEENTKMLAEVKKSCADKDADWDARVKARSAEQLALADTIKMLNSDDALELFKKTVGPNPSLLQIDDSWAQRTSRVAEALRSKRNPHLSLIALSLAGKKVDLTQIFKKIDNLIAMMKKEQVTDDKKKEYCNAEFDTTDDKKKALNSKLKELSGSIEAGTQGIETLESEIKDINAGVKELDASIAQAGENRQKEHQEYLELVAGNNQAVELLGMAENRLNKVYNPDMVKEKKKDEFDPYAFVQLKSDSEGDGDKVDVGTPPPTFGDFKKQNQGSMSVIQMIGTIKADLKSEVAAAKTEEQDSQKDYEETVKMAKETREQDLKRAAGKAKSKAEVREDLTEAKSTKEAKSKDMMALEEQIRDLHTECDWMIKNFDLRKQARAEEMESLATAKATLAGADFGFFQLAKDTTRRLLRGA